MATAWEPLLKQSCIFWEELMPPLQIIGKLVKFYDFGGGPIIGVKYGDEEKMLPFSKKFIINIDRDLRLITLSSSIKTLIN